jgi:hypothetical protein
MFLLFLLLRRLQKLLLGDWEGWVKVNFIALVSRLDL